MLGRRRDCEAIHLPSFCVMDNYVEGQGPQRGGYAYSISFILSRTVYTLPTGGSFQPANFAYYSSHLVM